MKMKYQSGPVQLAHTPLSQVNKRHSSDRSTQALFSRTSCPHPRRSHILRSHIPKRKATGVSSMPPRTSSLSWRLKSYLNESRYRCLRHPVIYEDRLFMSPPLLILFLDSIEHFIFGCRNINTVHSDGTTMYA